jgi:hypothetical protein
MFKLALVLMVSTVLFGCQSGYQIRYDSSPQSALLICENAQQGYTPVTLNYSRKTIKNGVLRAASCKATWVSGAQAAYPTIYDQKNYPKGYVTSVSRPNDPNLSNDIQFDYQRKQNDADAAQKRADAAQKRADESTNNSGNSYKQTQTSCTKIGFQVICNTY